VVEAHFTGCVKGRGTLAQPDRRSNVLDIAAHITDEELNIHG